MTVDERGRQAASALLESTRHDLEAFRMLKEVTATQARPHQSSSRGVIAALAAVATIIALAAGWLWFRSPQATSTPPANSQSATPSGTPVVSSVHKYTAVAPVGWTFQSASKQWPVGADPSAAGIRDSFRSPSSPATIFVSSQALPQGMTQTQWLTNFLPGSGVARPSCFPATAALWDQNRVVVDGRTGGTWGGAEGCSFTEVVVFSGNRVYDISAQPDPAKVNTDIFDNAVLTPFLASMRLTP